MAVVDYGYGYGYGCDYDDSPQVFYPFLYHRRGTMDLSTTKILSIHVDALLPPTSAELDLPHSAQVTALLGVGLVYQGTAHRRMAEVLLSEIGEVHSNLWIRDISCFQ